MKRKRKIVTVLLIAIAALMFCLACLPIYRFVPLVHDGSGDHNLTQIELAKRSDLDAIADILDRYGERYWRAKSSIRIPLALYLDDELRWNFTSKAGLNR
jgi:hypothetical protein